MTMLDRKRPFSIVSGHVGASYEQDGRLFNGAGHQVDDEGALILSEAEPDLTMFPENPPETEEEARALLMKLTKKQLVDIVLGGSKFASPAPDSAPPAVVSSQAEAVHVQEPETDFNALRSKFEVED